MLSFNPLTSTLIATAGCSICFTMLVSPHFSSCISVYSSSPLVFTFSVYNAYIFTVKSPSDNVYPFAFVKLFFPGTVTDVNLYSSSVNV